MTHHRRWGRARARSARLWAGSAVAVLALGGCETRANVAPGLDVRDSVGVRISHSHSPEWTEGEGWRLTDEPLLTVGQLDGPAEQILFRVSGATRLGDGSVAIANAGSYELRFYDGEARFLFAAGRQGEGPGEFTGLSRLVGARDSLFVYDQLGARISVFDRSGRFARSFSPPLLDGNRRSGFLGVFTDGSLLMATIGSYAASDPRRGIIRDSLTYVRADRSGEPLTSIARYPGNEGYAPERDSGVMYLGLPFGGISSVAVGGDELYLGAGDERGIEVWSNGGELRRLLRWDSPATPVTPGDVEYVIQDRLGRAAEGDRIRLGALYRSIPYPEKMPLFAQLRADDDGNLWIGHYRAVGRDQEVVWTVLDPLGRWLGEVRMPDGFAVFEIGSDYILGRRTDELGIERVEMYGLLK